MAKTFKRNYSSLVDFPWHLQSSDFLGGMVSSVRTQDLFEVSQDGQLKIAELKLHLAFEKVGPVYVSLFFSPLIQLDFDR